jgi:3-methyladenine DNA glycosylase Tag
VLSENRAIFQFPHQNLSHELQTVPGTESGDMISLSRMPAKGSGGSPFSTVACTTESNTTSRDFGWEGLNFLGSPICYALMPATGVVKTIS